MKIMKTVKMKMKQVDIPRERLKVDGEDLEENQGEAMLSTTI